MTLSDRMHYAGIVNSRKFAQLSWFQRDFFRNLIHAADGHGRFEADAELLRTVLYGLLTHKVSTRDVQEAMARCHQIGLVKLYSVGGRGYGKVINYRQTLTKRRALYPDEDGPPGEPELFTPNPPPSPAFASEGKKEGTPPIAPRPAGGGDASPKGAKTGKPARFRRAERLDTLNDERERLEDDMRAILRPGGCAYAVEPTDPEKRDRLAGLRTAHAALLKRIEERRAELAREDAA